MEILTTTRYKRERNPAKLGGIFRKKGKPTKHERSRVPGPYPLFEGKNVLGL